MATPTTSLISAFMPRHSIKQFDCVAIAAEPARVYAAARAVDMYRLPFARALFELRLLPERAVARMRGQPYAATPSLRIDDIVREGSGFVLLSEAQGHEVVVGAVGKFWQSAIEFAQVRPETFRAFDEPGYGKLAWCLRVDPRQGGGSWLSAEVRVDATDPASLRRFKRYWALIGSFSHAIRHGVLRLLANELGAAPADESRALAGDELLANVRLVKTHATTIAAPVEQVWPWLVQMGARRAGWYSFDRLDNGGVPSAEHIIPELQSLSVGDVIPALPKSPDGFAVLSMEPRRFLVLGDPSLAPGLTRPDAAPPWKTTWAFVLEPIGSVATRLIVRVRGAYEPDAKMMVMAPLLGLAHEVMERRQLHNLRRRAESTAAA